MMATMIPLAVTVLNFSKVTQIPGPVLVMARIFVSGILYTLGPSASRCSRLPFAFDRVVGTIEE